MLTMTDTPHPDHPDPPAHGAIERLYRLLDDLSGPAQSADEALPPPKATLGSVIDALDERAYGVMLLLLAIPCCLPFVYLLPQIVALPMLALAAQLALGRETPWLPRKLNEREVDLDNMRRTVARAAKYGGWIERFTHARLRHLSDGIGARLVGGLLLIPCASILVPLPLTNTTPGIGVAIAALGLVERDGLMILAGLAIGLAWVFVLVFFGAEAVSFVKDWLLARVG